MEHIFLKQRKANPESKPTTASTAFLPGHADASLGPIVVSELTLRNNRSDSSRTS